MTTPSYIVVLPSAAYNSIRGQSSSVPQFFQVGTESFVFISSPSACEMQLAKALVLEGSTAGILPLTVLRPQALFFDMDATVIEEESLVEIAKAGGKGEEIERLTEVAMAGQMDFAASLQIRLSILKGLPRELVLSIKPTFSRGMRGLAQYCADEGVPIFLVSGGFVDLAEPVAKDLGFLDFRANRFLWDGDVLAGSVDGKILDAQGKLSAVETWCSAYRFDPSRCMAIGDGANDLSMMAYCGASVGFAPKPALWPHISLCNATGSHTLLESILRQVP